MTIIRGRTIHPGVAAGPIRLYREASPCPSAPALSPQAELARFRAAQDRAAGELAELLERTRRRLGEELAEIFQIQAVMLEDPDFLYRRIKVRMLLVDGSDVV